MADFAEPLQRLIQECKRLPGIGQKSAQRIAFHLLRVPREEAQALAQAVLDIKDKLGICIQCQNISDGELCVYCRDPHRDATQICVVEEPHNIVPVETTRTFHGLYHVLHGAISPLRGIGPEQLRIKGLVDRLSKGDVQEVIIATNPTVEGRGDGGLFIAFAEAAGAEGDADCDGHSGGQRFGIRG
jgi:recombination protein RecR